ncbi:unnamed protein product [Owenia fusiformis]|uniref:Uncharacterized protein n=1 Tax=Owenia fusiformis TaxID=6347 RepID=A0A8J1XKH1_OWEFU|nr:unnamed protein product [Owenia fusiformis]
MRMNFFAIFIILISSSVSMYIFFYNRGNLTIKKDLRQPGLESDPDSVDLKNLKIQYIPTEETLIWTKPTTCDRESGYHTCVDCFNGKSYVSGYKVIQSYPGVNCSHSTCHKINPGRQPVKYRQQKYIRPLSPIEDMVTLAVKTSKRLDLVKRLLLSVWDFYPKMKCIVIDDYNEDFAQNPDLQHFFNNSTNVIYHQAHNDAGISYGRNLALNFVKTKYVFLTDDDMVFSSKTNITKLVDLLEHTDLTIAGATCKPNHPFEGVFMVRPTYPNAQNTSTMASYETVDLLQYPSMYFERLQCYGQCYVTDIILNAFLAPLEQLLKMGGWDASIKTQEHMDFFLTVRKFGLKVADCFDVEVLHRSPANNPLRMKRMKNSNIYFKLIKQKWNFSKWFLCNPKSGFSSHQKMKFPDDWICSTYLNFDKL